MKKSRLALCLGLSMLGLVMVGMTVWAQCCGGGCCSGGSCGGGMMFAPPMHLAPRSSYGSAEVDLHWEPVPGAPAQRALFAHGKQVLNLDREKGVSRTYDASTDTWGPPIYPWGYGKAGCSCSPDCPCGWDCDCCQTGKKCCPDCKCGQNGKCKNGRCPVPAKRQRQQSSADDPLSEEPQITNYGLDTKEIGKKGECYTYFDGKQMHKLTREAAERVMYGDPAGIPDDANKLSLTVIGGDKERKEVLDSIDPAVKAQVKVQSYPPDHWSVNGTGHVTSGHPTTYLQGPNGKVILRDDDKPDISVLTGAIRKADPKYNPALDPSTKQPAFVGVNYLPLLFLGGLLLFLLSLKGGVA